MSYRETGSERDIASVIVHGTAIAVAGEAALIRGRSGAGKSDLALRCLATPRSALIPVAAELVSDDQVVLVPSAHNIRVEAPASIAGKLEIRGVGIVPVKAVGSARLALVVDLVAPGEVERYPLTQATTRLLDRDVPVLRLAPFETSSATKLLVALCRGRDLFASP